MYLIIIPRWDSTQIEPTCLLTLRDKQVRERDQPFEQQEKEEEEISHEKDNTPGNWQCTQRISHPIHHEVWPEVVFYPKA